MKTLMFPNFNIKEIINDKNLNLRVKALTHRVTETGLTMPQSLQSTQLRLSGNLAGKQIFQLFELSVIRSKFLSPLELRITGSLL